ncbi:MAG: NYN domain-containing protein [Chloroflexi bacterium]|nr:NYN domain-containing protein [Chloroflexota bacterium]
MAQKAPLRLMVFIDAQNAYRGAREAFFPLDSPHTDGQVDPMKVGHLLESKGGPPDTTSRLTQVRVYTGRPDSTKDPRTYGAHMRQCAKWEKSGIVVIPRGLRYPRDWLKSKAQENGIDVSLALDFVTMALDGQYDMGDNRVDRYGPYSRSGSSLQALRRQVLRRHRRLAERREPEAAGDTVTKSVVPLAGPQGL